MAEAGDPVAQGVLAQAAQDLITFVLLVRSKLRRKHNIAGEVPVAWTGSVIEKMRQVREPFFAGLKAAAPEMPVFTSAVVSLEGAVWRAVESGALPADLAAPGAGVTTRAAADAVLARL